MYCCHSGGTDVRRRDRIDRARLDACVAVDALLRVDVQLLSRVEAGLVGARMDAVDRTTSTHEVSFVPMHGSLITYAMTLGLPSRYSHECGKIPQSASIFQACCAKLLTMDPSDAAHRLLAQPTRAQLFGALTSSGALREPRSWPAPGTASRTACAFTLSGCATPASCARAPRQRTRDDRGTCGRSLRTPGPDGDPPTAYTDLGRWLARIIAQGKTSTRAVEATGREIGRDLAPRGDDRPAEARMRAALVSMGFAPERDATAPAR